MSRHYCAVDGCTKPEKAKKLCAMHYERMRAHGSLTADFRRKTVRKPRKRGMYLSVKMADGRTVNMHRLVAEKALAKPLPSDAVVHHHYGSPSTLVICPNQSYHMLLHRRMKLMRKEESLKRDD